MRWWGNEESEGGVSDNPRHLSDSNEHYTPQDVVERARRLLRSIDLDPASCAEANTIVRADRYFTIDDDGLSKQWYGRVFLNPPGGKTPDGKSSQKTWWYKLAEEYGAGRVTAAVFVCFSVELFQTCQVKAPKHLITPLACPICIPSRRVAYLKPGLKAGKSPPRSSAIIWLPGEEWCGHTIEAECGDLGECINLDTNPLGHARELYKRKEMPTPLANML